MFAKSLSDKGFDVFVMKMPLNLSILSNNKADLIVNNSNEYTDYIFIGHSLGGTSISYYVHDNPDKVKGIVFLGSYPNTDLSNLNIPTLSIIGSDDLIVNRTNLEKNKIYLPKDNENIDLVGGNHGNFGNYGHQKKDGNGSLSNSEQQSKTIDYITKMFLPAN